MVKGKQALHVKIQRVGHRKKKSVIKKTENLLVDFLHISDGLYCGIVFVEMITMIVLPVRGLPYRARSHAV